MQQVVIKYNPYKMETDFTVDGINIAGTPDYSDIDYFIENKIPLQTWIEPITYRQWNGILSALKADDCEDAINFEFYGRKIDFDDFVRACERQNDSREYKLELNFNLHAVRSDVETAKKIEEIKDIILSEDFAEIMAEYPEDSKITTVYRGIEKEYNRAKNKEFRVVFAGVYSSGKSMIINTLIRHDILPVNKDTCTAKVCRIVHDKSCSDIITLECFDKEGNSVIGLHEFDSDIACLNFFNALVPLNTTDVKIPEFDSIEIRLDLSHLYPSKEMESEFTLTIVDTPGTNSSKTMTETDDGIINIDKQITLDAINNHNKDMVIICFDADYTEMDSIDFLLHDIYQASCEDNGSFTDRFMFVANKCDSATYDNGDNIFLSKDKILKRLANKDTIGAHGNDEFIPKLYMTSAYVQYAIQKHAYQFSLPERKEDKTKKNLYNGYDTFRKRVIEEDDTDYILSQACDIPAYRKQVFANQFEQLIEKDAIPEAVSIQTGIPCIECTIRDYIERYAFPFKVRDLMESFEILLQAVDADIAHKTDLISELNEQLGENNRQREEAQDGKSTAEQRKEKVARIKESIANSKANIESINIDGTLMEIAEDFETEIESHNDVAWISNHRDDLQPKEKIDSLFNTVEHLLSHAAEKAEKRFTEFEQSYKTTINKILEDLKSVCDEFNSDGYDFQNSITMLQIKEINIQKLREDTNETESTRTVKRTNPIKLQTYKKYQIFKRLKQWFADDYIDVKENVYSIQPLHTFLTNRLHEFRTLCLGTEAVYEKDLCLIKQRAIEKIDALSHEIDELVTSISAFEKELMELKNNHNKLNIRMNKLQAQSSTLVQLRNELSFGGNNHV